MIKLKKVRWTKEEIQVLFDKGPSEASKFLRRTFTACQLKYWRERNKRGLTNNSNVTPSKEKLVMPKFEFRDPTLEKEEENYKEYKIPLKVEVDGCSEETVKFTEDYLSKNRTTTFKYIIEGTEVSREEFYASLKSGDKFIGEVKEVTAQESETAISEADNTSTKKEEGFWATLLTRLGW